MESTSSRDMTESKEQEDNKQQGDKPEQTALEDFEEHVPNATLDIQPTVEGPMPPSIIATLFWAVVLYLVPNVVVGFGFNVYADVANIDDAGRWFGKIETLLLMTFAVFFVMGPLLFWLTKALEKTTPLKVYLNVASHSTVDIIKCVGLTAVFWFLLSELAILLNVPEEPFLQQVKLADLPVWFICLNICILAPVFEELVFRGFLYKRFASTKLSVIGAALLTSALFAVVHGQYSLTGVAMVFVLGLYFMWIRIKYNSTTQAMVAHATSNTMTMIAVYWFL